MLLISFLINILQHFVTLENKLFSILFYIKFVQFEKLNRNDFFYDQRIRFLSGYFLPSQNLIISSLNTEIAFQRKLKLLFKILPMETDLHLYKIIMKTQKKQNKTGKLENGVNRKTNLISLIVPIPLQSGIEQFCSISTCLFSGQSTFFVVGFDATLTLWEVKYIYCLT